MNSHSDFIAPANSTVLKYTLSIPSWPLLSSHLFLLPTAGLYLLPSKLSGMMNLRFVAFLSLVGLLQVSLLFNGFGAAAPSTQVRRTIFPRNLLELPCTAPDSLNPCDTNEWPCGLSPNSSSLDHLNQQNVELWLGAERQHFLDCKSNSQNACHRPDMVKFVADWLRATYTFGVSAGVMDCNPTTDCTVSRQVLLQCKELHQLTFATI